MDSNQRIKNATPGTTRRGEDTLREKVAEVRGLGDRSGTSRDEVIGQPYSSAVDVPQSSGEAASVERGGKLHRSRAVGSTFIVCAGSPGTVIEKGERGPGALASPALRLPTCFPATAAALIENGERESPTRAVADFSAIPLIEKGEHEAPRDLCMDSTRSWAWKRSRTFDASPLVEDGADRTASPGTAEHSYESSELTPHSLVTSWQPPKLLPPFSAGVVTPEKSVGTGPRTNRPAHIAELIDALEIVDLPSLARALLGRE